MAVAAAAEAVLLLGHRLFKGGLGCGMLCLGACRRRNLAIRGVGLRQQAQLGDAGFEDRTNLLDGFSWKIRDVRKLRPESPAQRCELLASDRLSVIQYAPHHAEDATDVLDELLLRDAQTQERGNSRLHGAG